MVYSGIQSLITCDKEAAQAGTVTGSGTQVTGAGDAEGVWSEKEGSTRAGEAGTRARHSAIYLIRQAAQPRPLN